MDNGLIFPYPCAAARAAATDAKPRAACPFGGGRGGAVQSGRLVSRRGDAGGQLYRAVVVPG